MTISAAPWFTELLATISFVYGKVIIRLDGPAVRIASAATGFFASQGNITITFESARADHCVSPGPVNRVVAGRVVMPAQAAQALAVGLFDFLEKQGYKYEKPGS